MELSTAQQILVIILASALAVFLVLSIAIAILIIRLLTTLRMVADKAEKFVESAEAVGEIFKNVAGPVGVFKFLRGLVHTVHSKQDKNK